MRAKAVYVGNKDATRAAYPVLARIAHRVRAARLIALRFEENDPPIDTLDIHLRRDTETICFAIEPAPRAVRT